LQPDHQGLQGFPVIGSVVDIATKAANFLVDKRISLDHISLLRPGIIYPEKYIE
jgi:hypothetical protein